MKLNVPWFTPELCKISQIRNKHKMTQLANTDYCTRVLRISNLNKITSTEKWDLSHKRKLLVHSVPVISSSIQSSQKF